MKKKISIKYYRNASSSVVAEVDYNELRTTYYSKADRYIRLMGSNEDRTEAYLMRTGCIKINITSYTKLKEGFEQEYQSKIN